MIELKVVHESYLGLFNPNWKENSGSHEIKRGYEVNSKKRNALVERKNKFSRRKKCNK